MNSCDTFSHVILAKKNVFWSTHLINNCFNFSNILQNEIYHVHNYVRCDAHAIITPIFKHIHVMVWYGFIRHVPQQISPKPSLSLQCFHWLHYTTSVNNNNEEATKRSSSIFISNVTTMNLKQNLF